jgi:carbon monoxide dehydrogenase subunit G
MIIESTHVSVPATNEQVADFLQDAQNLIHLLPQDQISDWNATVEQCSFKVQGGVVISLVESGREGTSKIFLKSGAKSPFPFQLTVHLEENGQETKGYLVFNGEVNVFLKMMVEKPLTALFNMMSENLKGYFTSRS